AVQPDLLASEMKTAFESRIIHETETERLLDLVRVFAREKDHGNMGLEDFHRRHGIRIGTRSRQVADQPVEVHQAPRCKEGSAGILKASRVLRVGMESSCPPEPPETGRPRH